MVLILLGGVHQVIGAARTASLSGDWNNTATWGGAAVPTATDDITIAAGVTVTMNVAGSCSVITSIGNGASIIGANSLTLQPASTITVAAGATATIYCPVAGAGTSLTISAGTGSLILSGTNTYAGTTTLSTGSLYISNNLALGTAAGGTTIKDAAVGLFLSGGITVSGELLTIETTALQTSGDGVETWAGNINISAGTSPTFYSISNNAALRITGNIAFQGTNPITNFNLSGGSNNDLNEISGVISGTGYVRKINGSTHWTLSGTNTFSGGTDDDGIVGVGVVFEAGTLNINNAAALGASGNIFHLAAGGIGNTLTIDNKSAGAITTSNYPILFGTSNLIFPGTNNLNLGSGAITLQTSPIVTVNNNTLALGGVISGAFGLEKEGAGTLLLSGANTYTGTTTISEGILKLQNGAFSTTPRSYSISSGAVLNLDGNTGVATGTSAINGNGTLRISGGTFANENPNTPIGTGRNITMSLGSGALIDIQSGAKMINGGWQNINWTNNMADLNIDVDGTFDMWDGRTVYVDALTGSGTVDKNQGGAVSNTTLTVGIDNGSGNFNGIIKNTQGSVILVKNGNGTQTLSGANTYSGTTTISAGTLKLGNPSALGATTNGTSITGGAVLDLNGVNYTYTEALTVNGTGISGSGTVINSSTTGATFAGLLTLGSASSIVGGAGTIDLSNTGTITGAGYGLTLGGAQGGTVRSIIGTGTGSLTKVDAGTWTLTGANSYTGSTTINAGDLRLNPTGDISINTQVILNGGKLSTTGITANRLITNSSTLNLNATSNIDLGANIHSLKFAPSNGITWNGSNLTINGWTGIAGQSGTAGKIFFGTTTGTLTAAQLAKITFTGYLGTPILLPSGELVPAGPTLTITGTPTDLGGLCIGIASNQVTYTITNTGATAVGLTLSSNNPQFVVSNLSSTTITGGGGTVTFLVTFTPTSIGVQNATITVATTTPNANSLTLLLSGTGFALPVTLVLSGSAICTTPGGNGTITSTSSATGVHYQLYNSSNTAVQASQAGIGSALTWSSLQAGTGYYAIATDDTHSCVSPQSNTADVATIANPSITGTLTVCAGSTTQLTGSGTPASASPWFSASTGIATVDNSGLVTGVSAGTSVITYTDINGCSSTATVTVNALPVITTQPADELDCEGHIISFNVVASGSGLTYTWQRKKPSGSFTDIPSEPNVSYPSPGTIRLENVGNSDAPDGTQYRVVITNSNNCSITSSSATLIVNEITGITPTATVATICQGDNYSYTVSTSYPSNVVSYQWKKWNNPGQWDAVIDGGPISGATTNQLVFAGATPTESGRYKVTVVFHSSGADCNVTSDTRNRELIVNPLSTATAGGPDFICPSATPSPIVLAGASVGGSATTGAWSITNLTPANGGAIGTLSSTAQTSSPETVTYTPPANYVGIVTLTLTTDDPTGPCGGTSTTRTITLNPLPTTSPIYHR